MSARPDTWMKLYWGDYARDTGHLNAAGHGAYLMLIKHYWCSGGPISSDDDELWRIACCDSKTEWMKLKPKVARMFVDVDGRLHHKRIDRELSEALATTSAKAEAGKKGAERRWQRSGKAIAQPTSANGKPMAQPSIRHRQTDATPESASEREESKQAARAKGGHDPANGGGPNRWDDAAIVPHGLHPNVPPDDPTNVRDRDRPLVRGFFLDYTFLAAMEAAKMDPARSKATWKPVVEWLKDGIEPATIKAAIARCSSRDGYHPPRSLAFFDAAVREQRPSP